MRQFEAPVNTSQSISSRLNASASRAGASLFVASLDSATLPDMGDRSLDQEAHAYIRPRRRAAAVTKTVVRRARLPFPEPRLPDLGGEPADLALANEPMIFESGLRQVEENAGLKFIREMGPTPNEQRAISKETARPLQAKQAQVEATAAITPPANASVRRACAGQAFVFAPQGRDSLIAAAPAFDLERTETVIRRANSKLATTANDASAPQNRPMRYASLEENIVRMSERAPAKIAVLAVGVSEHAIGKVDRLAEVLRIKHSRRVRVLAAEQLEGLKLAPLLVGSAAGEVCLVACQAGAPRKTLPFLSQFDAVILMVEIGETPVDDAAEWADTIRRFEIPIVGVWAA